MARRYLNPDRPAASQVSDDVLVAARTRVAAAAERLREAERADPASPGWDAEYDAASRALRTAERRAEALEGLRAAQLERGGKREAAVKAAAKDLTSVSSGLAASRDRVAAAAAAHLKALAALASAIDAHNRLLAEGRAKIAALGLQMRDDLVDEGEEHAEGVFDGGGLLAGGIRWTPIPPGGVEAHALRLVFAGLGPLHPARVIGKYVWRQHEVEARPDGLRVPGLEDVGAVAPAAAAAAPLPGRASLQDLTADPARKPAARSGI